MSSDDRSRLMTAVRGRGNESTELRVVAIFRRLNIRGWRRHIRVAGCAPDFLFPEIRVAIFADGCFWHGCPRHYTIPKSRARYWREKLLLNRARDRRAAARLRDRGWSVWRVWECRIRTGSLPKPLLTRLQSTGGSRS